MTERQHKTIFYILLSAFVLVPLIAFFTTESQQAVPERLAKIDGIQLYMLEDQKTGQIVYFTRTRAAWDCHTELVNKVTVVTCDGESVSP